MAATDLKRKRFRTFTLVMLVLMSACNLLLIFVEMPRFEGFYRIMLLGSNLPAITTFILDYRIPLALLASAWLVAGIVLVRQGNRLAILVMHCGMLWCFLQVGLIVYGLFVALVGIPGGMSETTK